MYYPSLSYYNHCGCLIECSFSSSYRDLFANVAWHQNMFDSRIHNLKLMKYDSSQYCILHVSLVSSSKYFKEDIKKKLSTKGLWSICLGLYPDWSDDQWRMEINWYNYVSCHVPAATPEARKAIPSKWRACPISSHLSFTTELLYWDLEPWEVFSFGWCNALWL